MDTSKLLFGVAGRVGVVRERGSGLVWVKVEERVALAADEVVAAGGAAAGDADGLWVGEGGFQGLVVDGRDSVGT